VTIILFVVVDFMSYIRRKQSRVLDTQGEEGAEGKAGEFKK